jgi:hypothetical protein
MKLGRLCYMRGPAGIIVALAEELFGKGVAPQALLRLVPMAGNHAAFSPACAAVL